MGVNIGKLTKELDTAFDEVAEVIDAGGTANAQLLAAVGLMICERLDRIHDNLQMIASTHAEGR